MNINYDSILEKATTRQSLVCRLVEKCDDVEGIKTVIGRCHRSLLEIYALYHELDSEGRGLFPATVRTQLEYFDTHCQLLEQVLGHENISSVCGLNQFIKAIKES
jgi:hypothetical protein